MYRQTIPSAKHYIDETDIKSVVDTLRSGIFSNGDKTREFEKKFSQYIGVKYAVAVSSGTAGLHLAVRSLGIKEGDEVITTPFSFIASTNCFLYEKAKPVFVDIDRNSLNINPSLIESAITNKTKAILVVDVFGNPSLSKEIIEIGKKYKIPIIDDACEALGSSINGRMVGSIADISVFGFFPNKQITTGEGGMITTNSRDIYELCMSLRSQGRSKNGNWVFHERLGYNYRITEMEASLGLTQLEKLAWMMNEREKIKSWYNQNLSGLNDIELLGSAPDAKISSFVYVIRVKGDRRERLIKKLIENNIGYKTYFYPIHLQPYIMNEFGFTNGMFPVCEEAAAEALALPFFVGLREEDVKHVCDFIKSNL